MNHAAEPTVHVVEAARHLTVVVEELSVSGSQQKKGGTEDPERRQPMIEGRWSRKFLPLPRSIRQIRPVDQRELLKQSLTVRAEEGEVGIRHEVGFEDLMNGTDLLHCRLDVLGWLCTADLEVLGEHSTHLSLGYTDELRVQGRVEDDRQLKPRLGCGGSGGLAISDNLS